MAKSYGQLQDGIKDLKDFESKVAEKLKSYPFLKWQNKKTAKLVKKLYYKGYNLADTISFVILNS